MNKKLVFGAVLLGAMTLTSCVDDTESASVTAVRQAKVEQLKSIADLNKANAEAALINANATKAAQEALAEYNKAQAAYQQALADYQNAQNEAEKANAQATIAEAEVKKQRAANELQKLAGELELALINQKAQILEAQNRYNNALETQNTAEKTKLTKLFTNYKNALNTLYDAQSTLAQDEIELTRLQAGLSTSNASLQFLVNQNQKEINKLVADNLEMQTYIDTWSKYSKEEAQAAVDKAWQEREALDKDKEAAHKQYVNALNAQSAAQSALDGSAYMEAVNVIRNIGSTGNVQVKFVNSWDYGAPVEARNHWCAYISEYAYAPNYGYEVVKETYIPLFTNVEPQDPSKSIEFTLVNVYGDQTNYTQTVSYDEYTSYYDLVAGSMVKFIAAVEESNKSNVKNLEDATAYYDDAVKAQNDAQKAYDKSVAAEKAYNEAYETLNAANEAVNKAQQTVDNAGANATEAQKKALEDAKTAQTAAQTAYDKAYEVYQEDYNWQAENELNNTKAATVNALKYKNQCESYVKNDEKVLAELKANSEAITNGAAGNVANMKALNEANLALANAEKDDDLAENAYDLKNAEWQALLYKSNSDSNGQNVDSTITNYKSQIENNENRIATLNKENAEYQNQIDNGKVDNDKAIKEYQDKISKEKAQIEVYQKEYDIAKKALDDAMAEETPAE